MFRKQHERSAISVPFVAFRRGQSSLITAWRPFTRLTYNGSTGFDKNHTKLYFKTICTCLLIFLGMYTKRRGGWAWNPFQRFLVIRTVDKGNTLRPRRTKEFFISIVFLPVKYGRNSGWIKYLGCLVSGARFLRRSVRENRWVNTANLVPLSAARWPSKNRTTIRFVAKSSDLTEVDNPENDMAF